MKIDACPSFPGTCEEALRFYHEVLGGELLPFMRYEGSPAHNQMPPEWLTKVMHGAIEVGDIHLMGPELPPEQFEKLQGVHRSVNVDRAEDAERIFEALGEGGHVTLPPARRFGQNASACRGTVTAFTGW